MPWNSIDVKREVQFCVFWLITKGRVIIYTAKQGVWKKFGKPEYPRPMSSIILKQGVAESLLEDISNFRKNSDWYQSLGKTLSSTELILLRCTIQKRIFTLWSSWLWKGNNKKMLHNTSKSSFIRAIAGHFGIGICLLNLNNREITDQVINELLNETPRNCIIVIEGTCSLL